MRFVTLALMTLVAVTGCKKDEEAEPEVASVTLTVGGQTITVSSTGVVTGGPITFTRPTAPAITASFKKADGTEDAVAHGAEFQLNAAPANTALLTFTRSSAFAGTLTGLAAGATQLGVSLFHTVEQHDDFGPFNVSVTVQ